MLYWGFCKENGRENGNYYSGLRVYLEGQGDLVITLKNKGDNWGCYIRVIGVIRLNPKP